MEWVNGSSNNRRAQRHHLSHFFGEGRGGGVIQVNEILVF